MTTDPHPLLAALREEIIAYLKRTTVDDEWTEQSADTIVELLHERLGPVLRVGGELSKAAKEVSETLWLGEKKTGRSVILEQRKISEWAQEYDDAVMRAGRPGGEGKG